MQRVKVTITFEDGVISHYIARSSEYNDQENLVLILEDDRIVTVGMRYVYTIVEEVVDESN